MNKKVKIFCRNTSAYYSFPVGTSLLKIRDSIPELQHASDLVVALVNNKEERLTFEVFKPKTIEFLDLSNPIGMRTYVRTLCMVMAKAIHDLYPRAILHIEHPLAKGYYCYITNLGDRMLNDDMVTAIQLRMSEIIAARLPITLHEDLKEQVLDKCRKFDDIDRVKLLTNHNVCYVSYYEIDGFFDFYNNVLFPDTGYLSLFDIFKYKQGIMLRVPCRSNPTVLEDYTEQPKMFDAFKNDLRISKILGVNNVGDLNEVIAAHKVYDLLRIAEALHEKQIVRIADDICANLDKKKFVMISGPSSSGKTTFSKRLSVQLMAAGIRPVTISLDDYFLPRDQTPRDESGDFDFESLYALDIPFFNEQLQQLLEGNDVQLPTYDFQSGTRVFRPENKVALHDDNIVVMEGIHALNPDLTPAIDRYNKYNIYVSALTTISLDNHNWIPTADNRLIRRILRDYKYRGNSARDTIARWPSVQRGEAKWIFPYQENADAMFSSAMIYELAALKPLLTPILAEVPKSCREYAEANRLAKFLSFFLPIPINDIPRGSLLREFVGGSDFTY